MLNFNQWITNRKLVESIESVVRLKDVATVKTNFPEADYWLKRKGSEKEVGRVLNEYDPEHIGIKINRTDILLPKYHYYMMMNLYHNGFWANHSNGTLNLKNIKTQDVANLKFVKGGHEL